MSAAVVVSAVDTARQRRMMHRFHTLGHYSDRQKKAVLEIYSAAVRHGDTGGGSRCRLLLLGLYNGPRFPFDLTDLRSLDASLYQAAMVVLDMDARRTWCEIHVLVDALLGEGARTGALFENWAFEMRLPKRCKKDQLPTWPTQPEIPAVPE